MIPEKIGRYEIRAELGRGGMATVYYAHDPRFKRDVAVKVLPREFLHDPTFRARFDREAQTIASLEHPAIVPVYDFGEEAGQPYLVMRFMPGGSLDGRLDRGPLSLAEAAGLMSRLALALDEAHAHGIIHRDLKPGNILFDQRGDPHISDFGLAKLSEVGATFTGSYLVGTPAYMSPEQARGQPDLDGRSDIYALGVILFEVLTGQHPYHAATPMGLAVKHITEPVPSILKTKPDLPPACETVIARAMAKQPEARFATARQLAAALEQVANGTLAALAQVNEATLILASEARAPVLTSQLARRRRIPLWGQIVAGFVALGLLGFCLASALPALMARAAATPTSIATSPVPTDSSSSALTLGATATPAPAQISGSTAMPQPTFTPTQTLVIRPTADAAQPTASPPAVVLSSPATPTGVTPTRSNQAAPTSTSSPAPSVSVPASITTPTPTGVASPTNPPLPVPTQTPAPTHTLVPPTDTNTPVPTTQVPSATPTPDNQGPILSNFNANPTTVVALSGCTVAFSADISDPSGVAAAAVQWQASGGGGSGSVPMSGPTSGGAWSVTTPVSVPLLGHVDWKVTASDAFGNTTTQDSRITINAIGSC